MTQLLNKEKKGLLRYFDIKNKANNELKLQVDLEEVIQEENDWKIIEKKSYEVINQSRKILEYQISKKKKKIEHYKYILHQLKSKKKAELSQIARRENFLLEPNMPHCKISEFRDRIKKQLLRSIKFYTPNTILRLQEWKKNLELVKNQQIMLNLLKYMKILQKKAIRSSTFLIPTDFDERGSSDLYWDDEHSLKAIKIMKKYENKIVVLYGGSFLLEFSEDKLAYFDKIERKMAKKFNQWVVIARLKLLEFRSIYQGEFLGGKLPYLNTVSRHLASWKLATISEDL